MASPSASRGGAERFEPIRLETVELGAPIADLEPEPGPDGSPYSRLLALATLHGEPLGLAQVELRDGRIDAGRLADLLWKQTGEPGRVHVSDDGGIPPQTVGADGISCEPLCARRRALFLDDAPPELTVLIPSRERAERLERCVRSILACDYPAERREVLVVDNNPATEATRRLCDRLAAEGERVRYEREDAPGSASARNRGLEVARTEIVAMTDDDTIADRNWLAEVALAFERHPEAICVSGLLVPAELDTEAQWHFEQYGGFTRGFETRVFDLSEHRVADPLYPWTAGVFGTGNNFSFRREPLLAIGGFDPALGNGTPALGGVDSEVLLRTILTGNTIVYEPRAFLHHAHRADADSLRRQVHAYGVGLTAYYLKTLHDNPGLAWDFARRIPAGLRFMLSSDSELNAQKQPDYPADLDRLSRAGMLKGPLAYVRSRRVYGRHRVAPALPGRLVGGRARRVAR